MDGRVGLKLLFFLFALRFAASAPAEARFSDSDLAARDAGQRLVAAASSERKIADSIGLLERYAPRLSDAEGRREAFSALARLRELFGSFSLAAEAWLSAAAADPGRRDDRAALEAARCLIAVGESERAAAEVAPILTAAAPDPAVFARARLIRAYAAAFLRDDSALPALKAFAADAVYASDHPNLLFLLARLFGDRPARERLLADFPGSPEALAIAGSTVALAAAPHWLLAADRALVSVKRQSASLPEIEEKPLSVSAGPVALQVGLFKAENNARALVSRLSAKGFAATIEPRTVGAASYYAVTVEPGPSAEETTMRLKDAGFESFPLF